MALLGGMLGQRLRGSGSSQRSNSKSNQEYERILTVNDFFDSDVSVSAGKYIQLGTYGIPPQLRAELGQGDKTLDPMEQGRPYIDHQNTSNAEDGFVKLTHENSTGNQKNTVVERRSEEFRESTRSERIVMPRASSKNGVNVLGEDDQFGWYFKADSGTAGTIGVDETTAQIPATFYERAF